MDEAKLDAFSDLLLQVYRVSAEVPLEDYQNEVLRLIKPVVAFDSSMWGTATFVPQHGLDIHSIHLHQQSPEMLQDYEPLKHLDTTADAVANKARTTQAFHCASWFDGSQFDAYRDFQRRHEIENVFISAYTDMATGAAQWVSLFRADQEQQCRPEEVSMLARIAPHLMQGLRHNHMRHMAALCDAHQEAAIVDARGVLHHMTLGCERLFRMEWGTLRRVGFLPAPLLAWLSTRSEPFMGRALVASRQIRQDLLFVNLRARCAADDLTPRQHEVAMLMAKGLSHKETAQQLGLAPSTVRKQIQNIYDKLEISHVAGLIEELEKLR